MIKNYLKTALRSILKKPVYSVINLLGLAVGIACSLLIVIYVHFELSFDQFHKNKEDIYRVNTRFKFGDVNDLINLTPSAVLGTLLQDFPEVENGTRVHKTFKPLVVTTEEDQYQESQFFYADSTFLQLFDYPLIAGNPSTALANVNNVILTESTAIKYFGTPDVLNKEIKVNNRNYLISGVAVDPPKNTHLQFDFLGSFVSLTWAANNDRWESANHFTYLQINPNADIAETGRKLQAKVLEKMGPFDGAIQVEMSLMPLADIHLKSDIAEELYKGDITYVYIFISIAALIIVMACVNYMNLSTARSVHRAKEVGMRKVLGAYKPQLFFQFIGESAIITLGAIILALVIAYGSIVPFSDVAGRPLSPDLFYSPTFYLILIGLWVLISFISGAYPAFVLSNYSPGRVLKSSFKDSGSGALLRKVLVVFQFGIAVFLFIGSMVIFSQLEYLQSKKLGYDKDRLILLPADREVYQSFQGFKAELQTIPGVESVALANESLSQVRGGYGLKVEDAAEDEAMLITAMIVSPEFVETTGLEIIAGQDFTTTDLTQASLEENRVQNLLINEETASFLYLTPEEAIGKKTDLDGRVGVIRGVLKNFHFRSLKEKIQPIALFMEPPYYNQMLVSSSGANPSQVLEQLKSKWEAAYSHRPFEAKFLDQEYNALYESEQQLKKVYSIFTGLAIFIGCLGLFGLVSYATVQRSKEIGIRKILGATVNSIIALISFDFLKLVLLGFLIATPIAYYLMDQWLTGFEYRIGFTWQIVVITLLSQMGIALLVTSWQSIRASLSNPVDAIRNE